MRIKSTLIINVIISLRFKYNINRFKLFHFENDVNSVIEYDDIKNRKLLYA